MSLAAEELSNAILPAPFIDTLVIWLAMNRRAAEALQVTVYFLVFLFHDFEWFYYMNEHLNVNSSSSAMHLLSFSLSYSSLVTFICQIHTTHLVSLRSLQRSEVVNDQLQSLELREILLKRYLMLPSFSNRILRWFLIHSIWCGMHCIAFRFVSRRSWWADYSWFTSNTHVMSCLYDYIKSGTWQGDYR